MFKSITLFVFLVILSSLLYSQEKSIPSESKIEKVIVFLQGAQVERTANLSIPNGTSTVVFKGLSSDIDEQSIQVKGAGNFTILSVNRQNNFLNEQKTNNEVRALEEEVFVLKDEFEINQNNNLILKKEEEMLAANQSIGSSTSGLDLNKLKQALDFQRQRLTDNKLKQLNNQKKVKELTEQIIKLEKQIKETKDKSKTSTSDIAVKVNAKTAASGTFRITYLVRNASWYPSYDLRATQVSKPVDLIYRANVSQQSGEEWKNVKLVLSSGDPSAGGNKPSLKPYKIGYNISYYTPDANVTTVSGKITDRQDGLALPGVGIRVKGTSIGTASDANGNYSIQIPSVNSFLEYSYIGYDKVERPVVSSHADVSLVAAKQALNEVVVVGYGTQREGEVATALQGRVTGVLIDGNSSSKSSVPLQVQIQQSQTTVQFEVEEPYSISSDGKQLAVELATHRLQADYTYFSVPKLSENAYLTAAVKGVSELSLMSGEANIFFEGAFLGKTLINVQNMSDTLSISLGVDKNVVIKRLQQKDQNEKSFMGGTQRATRAFAYQVLNRKNVPINLRLEDQIPVSNTNEVTVEKLQLSEAKVDENSGQLTWNLHVQPNEKKEIQMKYQVKYPRNRPVRLE